MQLKRETRILFLDKVENHVVAIVIRGTAGVENIIPIESCDKLVKFLESRKGIAAEINYILENSVCENVDQKTINFTEIGYRELKETVKEVTEMMNKVKMKLLQLKVRST